MGCSTGIPPEPELLLELTKQAAAPGQRNTMAPPEKRCPLHDHLAPASDAPAVRASTCSALLLRSTSRGDAVPSLQPAVADWLALANKATLPVVLLAAVAAVAAPVVVLPCAVVEAAPAAVVVVVTIDAAAVVVAGVGGGAWAGWVSPFALGPFNRPGV